MVNMTIYISDEDYRFLLEEADKAGITPQKYIALLVNTRKTGGMISRQSGLLTQLAELAQEESSKTNKLVKPEDLLQLAVKDFIKKRKRSSIWTDFVDSTQLGSEPGSA